MSVSGAPAPHSIQEINKLFGDVNEHLKQLETEIQKLHAQNAATKQTSTVNAGEVTKLKAQIEQMTKEHASEINNIYEEITKIDQKVQQSDKDLVAKEKEIEDQANGAGVTGGSGAATTEPPPLPKKKGKP